MTRSESSVVVSLAELMRLEKERVATEDLIARQREEERLADSARERAALLAREAEQQTADIERRRREEERQREEQVRLQSIRDAHLERARREAEIRMEADGRARVRERELAVKLRRWAIRLGAALLGSTILLLATIAFVQMRAEGRLDEMRRTHEIGERQWGDARRADQERARVAEERLGAALAELERAKKEPKALIERPREPRPKERNPQKREPALHGREPRCAPCPAGDPLCGCLEP